MKTKIKNYLQDTKAGKTEWIVLFVWLVLVCIIRYFHEPWFDETQAWQIARFASIKELLTEVEHYEGHPPFWHLLLMPFAKAEFPYKITIFCINTVFNVAALILLLFRSPLPRWLRCYLPFTYFIFYQHSVHTRPYSMMTLAFFLFAMLYKKRNEKPGFYILSLAFLCMTSAFGIMAAFGFCLVWLWEIILEHRKNDAVLRFLTDSRFWRMVLLGIFALCIYLCISPASDVVPYDPIFNSFDPQKLLGLVLILQIPFDCTFGVTINDSTNEIQVEFSTLIGCVAGALLLALFIPLLKKNHKLLIWLIPYLIFSLFSSLMFFSNHHLEVYQLFFIAILWILFEDEIQIPDFFKKLYNMISSKLVQTLGKIAVVAVLGFPIVCTCVASFNEIRYPYGPKEMVDFIKNHHLENRKIMTIWAVEYEETEQAGLNDIILDETLPYKKGPPITGENTILMGEPVSVYIDFDQEANFFSYYNVGESQQKWMIWRQQTVEETQEIFQKWQEIGLPDFVFGTAPLQEAFTPEQLDGVTYYWVDDLHFGNIMRLTYAEGIEHVYIRGDLLDQYPQFHVKTYAEEAKKK